MKQDESIQFDDIFKHIGSMGAYQILMFLILSISSFTANEILFNNFIGYTPAHWCCIEELEKLPHNVQKNVGVPLKKDSLGNTVFDSCKYHQLNYSKYNNEDFLNWNRSINLANDTKEAKCHNGWVYDQSVVISSIVTKWDLVCNDAWKVQFVSTIAVAGTMAGSLLIGPISDRFSRRVAIALFSFLKIGPAFLSAFSPIFPLMITANFFIAMGSAGNYILCFTTMIEIVGPSFRSSVGLGFPITYSLGFMCLAGYGYFIRDETRLQLLRAGISCILILAWWIIPDSPRWLLLNNQGEKAEIALKKMARINGKELPRDFDIKCIRVVKQPKSKANIIDVFKGPLMRKILLILCLHWFTDSLIFYALSLNTASLSGNVYLNTLLIGMIEIPANILGMVMIQWRQIGRRGAASLSLVLAGVSCLICIPLIITQVAPTAVTIFSLLGKAGSTMAFNVIYLYSSELFPTDVRDVGIGTCSFVSRISGMAAPFVGGPLGDVWAPLPNLIFGSFSLLTALLSLFLPETLGVNLPETIYVVEEQERLRKEGGKLPTKEYMMDLNGCTNTTFTEDFDTYL